MTRALFILTLLPFALGGCATVDRVGDPDDVPPRPPVAQLAPASDGAIYQAGGSAGLFEDLKPRQVGDILTVVLVENTSAQKSATTSTKKDASADLAAPTVFGRQVTIHGTPVLSGSLDGSREFDGSGAATQSNKLSGSLTVTVVERLPNGNLMVRGEKRLVLNQGEEKVRVSGIVRPADIGPDNSVLSSRIADAHIAYAGNGALADANSQGWLSRFFNSPIWPF